MCSSGKSWFNRIWKLCLPSFIRKYCSWLSLMSSLKCWSLILRIKSGLNWKLIEVFFSICLNLMMSDSTTLWLCGRQKNKKKLHLIKVMHSLMTRILREWKRLIKQINPRNLWRNKQKKNRWYNQEMDNKMKIAVRTMKIKIKIWKFKMIKIKINKSNKLVKNLDKWKWINQKKRRLEISSKCHLWKGIVMKMNVNIRGKDKLWRVLKSLLLQKTCKKLISV
jgi:hypothetical protein